MRPMPVRYAAIGQVAADLAKDAETIAALAPPIRLEARLYDSRSQVVRILKPRPSMNRSNEVEDLAPKLLIRCIEGGYFGHVIVP